MNKDSSGIKHIEIGILGRGLRQTKNGKNGQRKTNRKTKRKTDVQVRDQEWAAEGAITILPKRANINGF